LGSETRGVFCVAVVIRTHEFFVTGRQELRDLMHAPTPALLSNLSCVASPLRSPFLSETFVRFLNRTAYAPLLPSRHYEPRFTNAIVDGVKNVENRFGRVLNVQMFILSVAPRRLMLRVLCRYFSAVGDGGAAGLVKDIILDTGGNLNWLTVRLPCARLLRAITLSYLAFACSSCPPPRHSQPFSLSHHFSTCF
jgi:hypothetical protein